MSTITEERGQRFARPDGESRWSLDRLLAWRPPLTVEFAAYTAIFLIAFGLRFWDLGGRAMHHDESLHATYSWYLYKGRGYTHHPLMHGPLLFHVMALVYLLFGVSDATARFTPAAFGTAMVLLPLLLRPWIGRVGAFAAAALIALSPTILYFSRFVGAGAQDIIISVAMLLMVAGVWHYLRSERSGWLYLIAGGLALGFTTKEVTFMLAALLIVWLDGVAADGFAAQLAAERGWSNGRRRLVTVGFMPVAWALALFWPWLEGPRERLRLSELPRAAGPLILIGTLSAPMFSAGVQVPLQKIGVHMDALAPIQLGGNQWTNEQMWGAITIGILLALSAYFGTAWRAREWLISAAIFWGISVVLFTTFFTNEKGIATGIWGSLDYWLQQQGVNRGEQPVYYYMMLTPVYEYLTLGLALTGVVYAAIKTGRDTIIAAILAVVFAFLTALAGSGGPTALPFALGALLAATYAVRARPFQQFLVFWLGAIFLGLSVAGEKMPWLEVHVALPLALLAAMTVDYAVSAARRVSFGAWLRPVAAGAALGLVAAALTLASDRFGWALFGVLAVVLVGIAGAALLAVRRVPAAGFAAAALFLAFLGPLSVRSAVVAAYEHGDIPVEMLVYTQTTQELVQVKHEIDAYARESGLGLDTPIFVDDAGEGLTWPWAWYLRDYHNVSYPNLTGYLNNPSLLATLPPNGVVLAGLSNAGVPQSTPGEYGPGQRFKHRWWFPEDYRGTTAPKFFDWVREPSEWRLWGKYFLHRVVPSPLGSTDGMVFFPAGWTPGTGATGQAQPAAAAQPRMAANGQIVTGATGIGPGEFQRPAGLAVDTGGNVYVADSLNNRVQRLSADGHFDAMLTGPQRFQEPWGVAVGKDGSIYVADTWNHRIQKFDRGLNFVTMWGNPPKADDSNPDPLDLYGPRSIAIDADGNLWVTDTGHNRLVKFDPNGKPLATYGEMGAGPGQFQEPVAVAIAPDGDVVVADAWNGRVQRFDAAFGYKGEFHVDGWASDHGVENKPYLAVAPDGSVFVTVPDAGQVLHYGADGRPLGSAGPLPSDTGTPPRPIGVAVDGAGNVWVSDGAGNHVVRLGK